MRKKEQNKENKPKKVLHKEPTPKKEIKIEEMQFGSFSDNDSSSNDQNLVELPSNLINSLKIEEKPKPIIKKTIQVYTVKDAPIDTTSTWNSILKKEEKVEQEIVKVEEKKKSKKSKKKQENIGNEILESSIIEFNYKDLVFIQPRGLMNINNSCYINAALQSLLYLPPFYNLYKKMSKLKLDPNTYPLSKHIMQFINEFPTIDKNTTKIDSGSSFSPSYLLDYLYTLQSSTFQFGKQQDTQEFLGWLLEELSKEISRTKTNFQEEVLEYEDDWEQVGKNSKSQKVQEVKQKSNSISMIFSGKFKSIMKKRNVKPTVTLEPFYTLHLPIDESVESILDSFKWIAEEERMENDIIRQTKIEELPKVLILHLKRFTFEKGVSTKISKRVHFDEVLTLPKDLLSNQKSSPEYQLYSVVCHHGKDSSVGHYSTYISHPCNKWVHIDDAKSAFVSASHVLKQQAYLLIYIQKE